MGDGGLYSGYGYFSTNSETSATTLDGGVAWGDGGLGECLPPHNRLYIKLVQ